MRPLALALMVAACGGPMAVPHAPLAIDDAASLAGSLPMTTERCVVARPAVIAARRRPLALLQSWAEPSAWERGVAVVAYASAQAESRDGRYARVSLVRYATPEDAHRVAAA